jgi:hypothetical protein
MICGHPSLLILKAEQEERRLAHELAGNKKMKKVRERLEYFWPLVKGDVHVSRQKLLWG